MYWYNRRRLSRVDAIGEQRAVRELQEKWSGIMLFRNRFRVFPYGEDEDDWLGLDRRALRRSGYTLNKTQFIGRVNISRTANPNLVDQTNREGLRITPEQQVFLQVIRYAVQDWLGAFFVTSSGNTSIRRLIFPMREYKSTGLRIALRTPFTA